jgi:hypothetical protein
MPLAILLQEQLGVVTKGVKKVERWEAATEAFSLVVDRLRSAYLVHWFGTALPSVGIALRVAFANMDELRRRWIAIGSGRGGETPAVGPNLTEPLLGLSGTLVGIFTFPLNAALLSLVFTEVFDRWWVVTLAVANWLTAGVVGSGVLALVGVVGGVGLLFGLTAWAISGQPREAFDLLGAAAEALDALQGFWQQVTGPREAVRNPLLREILALGDRFAALIAFLLGAFAVLVTRVGPLLGPMRQSFLAVLGIAQDLWAVISLALSQTIDVLKGLLSGPDSIPQALGHVFDLVSSTLQHLGARLKDVWRLIVDEFEWLEWFSGMAIGWWALVAEPFIRSQTIDHPTIAYIRSLAAQLKVAGAWRARTAGPPAPPSPPSPPGMLSKIGAAILKKLGMPTVTPKLPGAPKLPPLLSLDLISPLAEVTHLLQLTGLVPGLAPNPLKVGPEGRAVLRRAARPPSVFGAEWAALRAEAKKPEPLERALETATYLSLAERVISPEAAGHVRQLEGLLSRIDAEIRTERARHPVKDVPEPTELRPAIRTLRVRARGLAPDALRAWVEDLRRELNAGPYPVPVEG